MGETTRYHWPFPESEDVADGAGQMESLGQAIDTTVGTVDTASTTLKGRVDSGQTWARFRQTYATPVAHNGWGTLTWGYDAGEGSPVIWDIMPDTTKLLCYVAGVYRVNIQVMLNCGASRSVGYGELSVAVGGTGIFNAITAQGGSILFDVRGSFLHRFAANAQMTVAVGNTTGGSFTPDTNAIRSRIEFTRVTF